MMACALDPANKTPGYEDRLPIVTASTEIPEGHDGVQEYAVKSTFEDNNNSKKDLENTSDVENISENNDEERQSAHDYEDLLASEEFSLNQFF